MVYKAMDPPNTPKTPTVSAWLALLDDEVKGEEFTEVPVPVQEEAKVESNEHWVYPFCNLIPSDAVKFVNEETLPTYEMAVKKPNEEHDDTQQNSQSQGFLQRIQMYYDNLQTTTFSKIIKIEEEISDRIEKVESPCKMMAAQSNAMFDEYDDQFMDTESEGDESTILEIDRQESPDIFHELQESIPSLRDRSNTFASSKYKALIGSSASLSVAESSKKESSLLITKEQFREDGHRNDQITSPRKFPTSNTFDQLNNDDDEDKAPKKVYGSPSRTMRTMKTENTTKLSDDSPKDPIDSSTTDETPTMPLSIVDLSTTSEIVKKISSLTGDGEMFYNESDPNYGAQDETKICVPPMLLKKLVSLRNLKLSRSLSSADSITTSARRALKNNDHVDGVPNEGRLIDDLFTEHGSKNHAYVAFFRRGFKATQSIRLYQHPIPAVFPIIDGEVVVHVEASTISQTDLQVRLGDFWGENSRRALNLPIVPGVSFSGIVYQTTQSALKSGLNVGDRVISLVQVGANSRHLCLNCDQLVKVPEELNDPCSTACIPEVYLTAFQALHMSQRNGGRYRKTSLAGKEILILGGASLIGRALIEVAVAAGCSKVYATGKEKQFQTIYDVGGAPLGRDPRLWRSLLSQKVDLIVGIDHSVGDSEINEDHVGLLSRNGRMILLCNPDRDEATLGIHNELVDFFKINGRKLSLYNVFDAWENELKQCKRDLTHLMKLLVEGSIRPNILEIIALNKVARAQDLLQGKMLPGFIICEPWMKGKMKNGYGPNHVYAESASKSTSQESLTIKTNNTEQNE
jgi:NADPH:quinone reductase-like Zn-dependent oxidoreductase